MASGVRKILYIAGILNTRVQNFKSIYYKKLEFDTRDIVILFAYVSYKCNLGLLGLLNVMWTTFVQLYIGSIIHDLQSQAFK